LGDWGLGIGDWAQSPIPNPQSPIPNPQYNLILNYLNVTILKSVNYMIEYYIFIKAKKYL